MKKIIQAIADFFTGFAVVLDESRRTNEDGSWDKYWERRNRREARREAKIAHKRTKSQAWQS